MNPASASLTSENVRQAFADRVLQGITGVLEHQQADGSIVFVPGTPDVYPQQAIFPLAFCWAGADAGKKLHKSPELLRCAQRLGECLVNRFDEEGRYAVDSYGYKVVGVDQRLTHAWTEALHLFREAGADLPYEAWETKILAACLHLITHRLQKLVGIRRFTVHAQKTSTNHVALYLSTIYRAGVVLNRPALCEFVLPIARALAADMHPDGYWDEHSDLLRTGGPTPSYNYLTLCAMGLMAEWTGEAIFRSAIDRSSAFHMNFSYPDACFCELLDERVRRDENPYERHYHYDLPRQWGLFAMSHTAQGRAWAARHLEQWIAWTRDPSNVSPQTLARHCENYLYWHNGPFEAPPTDNRQHSALMSMPAGVARRGAWFIALSAMPDRTSGDATFRDNPFALERQKLFSLWHESTGLILDGSHSKSQPENSTFWTSTNLQKPDYLPCGGTVSIGDSLRVDVAYRSFFGSVRLQPLDDQIVEIHFAIDAAGCSGPINAGFTLPVRDGDVVSASGERRTLGDDPFVLQGGFTHGGIQIDGPDDMKLHWPLSPFNSYRADHVAPRGMWQLRVAFELTRERPTATVRVRIAKV